MIREHDTAITEEQAIKAGGKLWGKYGKKRAYFNELENAIGLEINYYNTGNISSASLRGEKISNTKAGKILFMLNDAKVWYDFADNKFHGKADYGTRASDVTMEEVIASVEKMVANTL